LIPLRSDSLRWQYECGREELPQCKREKFLPVPKNQLQIHMQGMLSPPTAKNRNSFDRELSLSSKQGDKMWAKIRSKRESKGMVLYVCLA
jgi:hypothetical protein